MADLADRPRYAAVHPFQAMLLAFPIPLLLGTLLSDLAYFCTYQIQWANFASWLIAGALAFGGLTLLGAVIGYFRAPREGRSRRPAITIFLVLAMWVVGFIAALVHARDGWAIMPAGLILSAITTLLALAAAWAGYSGARRVEV